MCTCNKEHLTREWLVYVLNSCGLVKVVKKKVLSSFAYTGTNKACQGKLVKENLLVVQTRKLVKKLVKENLLVYAGL